MLEKYIKAGKILKEVREKAKKSIKVGEKLIDIAERVENEIVSLGGKPAFPANLSINNNAAHYSPSIDDETTVGERDVLKVDIGAHIDGYIADCAFTVDFSGENGKMIEAAEKALGNALAIVKEGVMLQDIGEEIEKTIKGYGFNPIQNLSGHALERWITHGSPSIPNIAKRDERQLEEGMCFAIEPFVTDGRGFVKEGGKAEIFQIDEPKPVRNIEARKIMEFVLECYKTLPFAERWLIKELKMSEFARKVALRELLQKKCIKAFPILHEEKGRIITQAETSILLNEGKAIRLL